MTLLTTNAATSQLVVIDMQTKLANAMPLEAFAQSQKKCAILLQAAQILAVQTIITEQYPQGLGATMPDLSLLSPNAKIISKTAFSAVGEPKFKQQLQRDKPQIILIGMEAHICVLQTALDLLQLTIAGDNKLAKQVFIVQDAIISRNPENKANAINRLQQAGCIITNTESVIFEWLGNANNAAFKAVSALIR